jgi:hypothetical protein
MVAQAFLYQLVINAICPRHQPNQLIKQRKNLFASSHTRFLTSKGLQQRWQQYWNHGMQGPYVLAAFYFVKPRYQHANQF